MEKSSIERSPSKSFDLYSAQHTSHDWLRQRAWVEVNLTALAHNVAQIKQLLSPQTDVMAVVKADAYGHGACAIAQTALNAGATWLGVATVPEGMELREAGIEAPILVLGAVNSPDEIRAIAQWQLQATIGSIEQAVVFSQTLGDQKISLPVHLKLDTGMSRLGTSWQQALEFVREVQKLPNLEIASLYSHLATADDPDRATMKQQHQRFQDAIAKLESQNLTLPRLHLANSAATLTSSALHYNMVRVGLALYGLYPATHLKSAIDLQPVLQVKARITQVKTVPAGTGISYNHKFVAPEEMRLAVVGIGYADGVPRNLSNKMQVLIRGQRVAQVGAITMDQLMLNVSNIPDVAVGEVVTLLGKDGDLEISADDWASTLGTISWEILCGFKHRLPRVAEGDI